MTVNSSNSAVILAGGKSNRMKKDKAMLKLHGKTMLEIIIDKLHPFFQEIIIISNKPELYEKFGLSIYCDIFPNHGPLAGIHTGLKNISNESAFFVACDMPFVSPQLANDLLLELHYYQAVVPKKEHFLQPLHAAYNKNCLPAIEESLQNNHTKITSFYNLVNVKYFNFQEHPEYNWDTIFFNVNTPDDYQIAQNLKGN